MSDVYDVIIAGAGPVGLFLACELGLARVSVLVLESDSSPESPWKTKPLGMRSLNTLSVETLYRRGLLDRVFEPGERPLQFKRTQGFQFGGHFAAIMLNANKLDLNRWPYLVNGPALVPGPTTIERIDTALTERAESLGVKIIRGAKVTKIKENNDNTVTVTADKDKVFSGKWLVGCDGGRSYVRRAARFEFEGTEARFTGYAVKCDWDDPEKLKPGFHVTERGMYIIGGPNALYLTDFDGGAFEQKHDITQQHLQSVLDRISGTNDFSLSKVHLATSFTDRCKQSSCYRKGRILLAGDAAHIHGPVGTQGLNLGLGDAMNLGWKLAATIRKEATSRPNSTNSALLDSYESERHPAGAWVLDWTRAQVSILQPDRYGAAARALVKDLIDTTDGTNLLIDRHWGLSQRYSVADDQEHAHPLVGCSMPDFELQDGSRLGSKLEEGHGLLVDFEDDAALKILTARGNFEPKVDYIGMSAKDTRCVRAFLVRPDGIVVWLAEEKSELNEHDANSALERWFGC